MSLKDLKTKSDAALASIPEARSPTDQRPSRATTTPGATAFMQPTIDALNSRAKIAEAKVVEYEKKLTNLPTELPLDSLKVVDSRKRKLTPEQFEELKLNLGNNPLIHPVTVRRLADGQFEIVSGHNRAAAFRALGRTTIPVVVIDLDESQVDRSAFYANLLQPSLPDYQKYQGFRQERERTGLNQKQMAKEAGIPESVVSMLFAFDQMPEKALGLIEERPEGIGMNCVAELARLVRDGKSESVIAAVELLVEGKLTQKEAIKYATRPVIVNHTDLQKSRETVRPVKVKVGRLDFCQYQMRGTSFRIDFKSEEHMREAESAIARILQELANQTQRDS